MNLTLNQLKKSSLLPCLHDTKQEMAQPLGMIKDWSKGECEPVPGKTMPQISVVERDYKLIYEKMISLGPNVKNAPYGIKGISWSAADEYEKLKKTLGEIRGGFADGCPSIESAKSASEAVLTLSSTSNGKMAVKAWEALEKKTDLELVDLSCRA